MQKQEPVPLAYRSPDTTGRPRLGALVTIPLILAALEACTLIVEIVAKAAERPANPEEGLFFSLLVALSGATMAVVGIVLSLIALAKGRGFMAQFSLTLNLLFFPIVYLILTG